MSLFSVSKLITLAPRVRHTILETIVTPSDLDSVGSVVAEMKVTFQSLLKRYVPGIESIPLKQGLRFQPTWKSVPSLPWYQKLLRRSGNDKGESLK